MPVPKSIHDDAKKIKLLVCDVDGVLTSGEIYLDNQEGELKAFNVKDGLGINLLMKNDIKVAIITGRNSPVVTRRMNELGIEHYYQGQRDKQAAFDDLLEKTALEKQQVAYVGDDLPDIPLMKQCGLSFAPNDSYRFVLEQVDWVLSANGGKGAVREISDILLASQDKLENIYRGYNS